MDITHVINTVCNFYGVTPDAVKAKKSGGRIRRARKAIQYICRKIGLWSLQEIGRHVCRHHATVIHNAKTAQDLMDTNKLYAIEMDILEEKVKKNDITNTTRESFKLYMEVKYEAAKQIDNNLDYTTFLLNALFDVAKIHGSI